MFGRFVIRRLIASFLAIFFCLGAAQAATIGYDLTIDGAPNDQPTFTLTNTGTVRLTSFSMTVGDPTKTFDRVFTSSLVSPSGGTIALTFGDTLNGGLRTSLISFAFTGFDMGESISFRAELDGLVGSSNEDFRAVFRNNGLLPNSVLSVGFETGASMITVMPDGSVLDSSIIIRQAPVPATVPLPPSVVLLGAALFALFGFSRRRKPALTAAAEA